MNDSPIPTVFVVDDDEASQAAICALMQSMDIASRGFSSAEQFLAFYRDQPGCLVCDCRLGGLSGIELQEELQRRGYSAPIVFVTAYARTSLTVRAMKNGAVTMLDKPFADDDLWYAVRDGLEQDRRHRETVQERIDALRRFDSLNSKEVEVLRLIVAGYPNKEMAAELQVSLRTIENRRRKVFAKIGVSSVAGLVTSAMTARLDRPHLLRSVPRPLGGKTGSASAELDEERSQGPSQGAPLRGDPGL